MIILPLLMWNFWIKMCKIIYLQDIVALSHGRN